MFNKINKIHINYLILLIIPIFYGFWLFIILNFKGPNWILIPQDLGYNYLISSVNFFNGDPLGSLIHPAIPNILIIGFLSFIYFKLINNEQEFLTSVLNDPESYFSISSNFIILLTIIFIFLVGYIVLKKFNKLQYSIFFQSFVLFANYQLIVFNNFASPESFLVLFFLIKIFFIFYHKDIDFKNWNQNLITFILINSFISALCIATKFIALPIFFLVFFFLEKNIHKILYTLSFILFCTLFFFPIFDPYNKFQFLNDLYGLLVTILRENSNSLGEMNAHIYLKKLFYNFKTFPSFFYIFLLNIFIYIFCSLQKKKPNNTFTKRLSEACLIVSTLAILLLTLRFNGGKYSFIYIPIILSSIFLIFENYFLISNIKNKNKFINYSLSIYFCLLFLNFFTINIEIFKGNNDYRIIKKMNDFLDEKNDNNNAIITQIPSSNIETATFHGFLTAQKLNKEIFRKNSSKNHFNYNLYHGQAYLYDNGSIDVIELKEKFNNVYFWTSKNAFFKSKNINPPKAIWKKEIESNKELLAKIIGLQIDDYKANRKKKWIKKNCKKKNCLIYENTSESKIDYLSLKNNLELKVKGSFDKINWQNINLKHLSDPRIFLYKKDSQKNIFKLINNKNFKFYKFEVNKDTKDLLLFSSGKCSKNEILFTKKNKFLSNNKKIETDNWFFDNEQSFSIRLISVKITMLKELNLNNERKISIKILRQKDDKFKKVFNYSFKFVSLDNKLGKIPGSFYKFSGDFPIIFESELIEETKLSGYKIIFNEKNFSQNPKKWSLLGSKDKKKWTILSQKSEKSGISKKINTQTIYNNNKYKYLRLEVYETYNGQNLVKFKNIKYYKKNSPGNETCTETM